MDSRIRISSLSLLNNLAFCLTRDYRPLAAFMCCSKAAVGSGFDKDFESANLEIPGGA